MAKRPKKAHSPTSDRAPATARGSNGTRRRRKRGENAMSSKRHGGKGSADDDQGSDRRAIWSGSLGFGLLQIPVSLYAAVKPNEIAFHQLDRRDHAPIRYKRVNEATGDEVEWKDIVKGYEVDKGRFVIVDDEDFERVAVRSTQQIDLRDFVRAEDILPIFYDTPYILGPAGRSAKAYGLFREALRRKGLAAIGTFVLRTREHACAVFPMEEALVLDVLRFEDELRGRQGLGIPRAGGPSRDADFSERELSMAEQLIESMRSDWDPKRYRDTYKDALVALLEKKAKTGKLPPIEKSKRPRENVVDLMTLLKKSISETAARGGATKRKHARDRAA